MKIIAAVFIAAILLFCGAQVSHAQEDITPPALLDVQFDPKMIDTSKGPVTVTVTIHVTDDLSGVEWVALAFYRPGTTQSRNVDIVPRSDTTTLLHGDHLDGYYSAMMTLPQYSAYGDWEMHYVALVDNVGNRAEAWKPDGDDEKARDEEWPSLYNGFVFAIGEAAAPQSQRLYIPAIISD